MGRARDRYTGCAFALILFVQDDAYTSLAVQFFEDVACAVFGPIIYDYDLSSYFVTLTRLRISQCFQLHC